MRLLALLVSAVVVICALSLKSPIAHKARGGGRVGGLFAGGNANQYTSSNVVETRNVNGLQYGMKMRNLPGTDLLVSELCLGTMMYGEQMNKAQSIAQLDKATKEYGINFIDCAESYPVPSAPSTTGRTESIIGDWMKSAGNREDVVISTKVCGYSKEITWCRSGEEATRVNRKQVIEAVDNQLRRLGTDYIDLLQIHWPDRYVPLFGSPDYLYELERSDSTPVKEQLEIMQELIQSGKVRHFGLSNETPYGLGEFVTTAKLLDLPKPCVTQNAYNLLCRNDFDTGMVEACSPANGDVGLLAGGALSGKYLPNYSKSKIGVPDNRFTKYVGFMHRYISPPAVAATTKYQEIADSFDLPLAGIALSYVTSRPFTTSTIFGATNNQQLEDNVLSLNIPISDEIHGEIDKIHKEHLDPTKGSFEIYDLSQEYIDPSKLPWGAKDQDVDPELDILINERLSKF